MAYTEDQRDEVRSQLNWFVTDLVALCGLIKDNIEGYIFDVWNVEI